MATKGKIKQIIGAVVDVHFPDDNTLPEIFNALEIEKENGIGNENTQEYLKFLKN